MQKMSTRYKSALKVKQKQANVAYEACNIIRAHLGPWFCKCCHLMASHVKVFGSDLYHRRRCNPLCSWVSSCVLCACEAVPCLQVREVGSCAHLLVRVLPEAAFCRTDHIPPHRSLCYLQKTGFWCTNDLQITNQLPTERFHVTFSDGVWVISKYRTGKG